MKRTVHTIAMALLASPLALVGCGSSDNNGGTGGTTGTIKWDGAAGTGGTAMDGGGTPDISTPGVETGIADTNVPIDVALPDAPAAPDAPAVDTRQSPDLKVVVDAPPVDRRPPTVEVNPVEVEPVDTTPIIDTTPVESCTETKKFTGGDVTKDRTLTKACSPYTIKEMIDVSGNATLTIEAGVTLRFQQDIKFVVGSTGSAKLVAVGTAAEPIVLTSAVSSPSAGDWPGLLLSSSTMGGTNLTHVKLEYCGADGGACVYGTTVKPGRVTIDYVTIGHVGAGADGIVEDNEANFAISNCTFNEIPKTPTQQYAISVPAPSFAGIDSTNTFNGDAMIELAGDTVSVTTTWKNPGTTIAVTSNLEVDGKPAPVLTIEAGTKFEFAKDVKFKIGDYEGGTLKVDGTEAARVTFTTLDKPAKAGAWEGILVSDKATIVYADISYAGASWGDVVAMNDESVLDIQNSTISNSGAYGISIDCGSTATVTNKNNTFTSNAKADVGPGPTGPACN